MVSSRSSPSLFPLSLSPLFSLRNQGEPKYFFPIVSFGLFTFFEWIAKASFSARRSECLFHFPLDIRLKLGDTLYLSHFLLFLSLQVPQLMAAATATAAVASAANAADQPLFGERWVTGSCCAQSHGVGRAVSCSP